MFSFNSPFGACPGCDGLGIRMEVDPELVLDRRRSVRDGGILPWANSHSRWLWSVLEAVCERIGLDPEKPLSQATPEQIQVLLYGTGGENVRFTYRNQHGRARVYETPFEGVMAWLQRKHREAQSDWGRSEVEQYMASQLCPVCQGAASGKRASRSWWGARTWWRCPVSRSGSDSASSRSWSSASGSG